MRSIYLAALTVSVVWNLAGMVSAGSFNEVTSARITLEGTARFFFMNEVQTGILGQGSFSFAPENWEKTYEIPFTQGSVVITKSDNYRLVTQFQLDLLGRQITPGFLGSGSGQSSSSVDYLWKLPLDAGDQFPGGGMVPGHVLHESTGGPQGTFSMREQWRFGKLIGSTDLLTLDRDGTWQYIYNGSEQRVVTASGTWTATPESVPEPLTIAATGLAVVGGIVLRKTKSYLSSK